MEFHFPEQFRSWYNENNQRGWWKKRREVQQKIRAYDQWNSWIMLKLFIWTGREQKAWIVGGGEISVSREAVGLSQNTVSLSDSQKNKYPWGGALYTIWAHPWGGEKHSQAFTVLLFHLCCVSAHPLSSITRSFIDSGVRACLGSAFSTETNKYFEKLWHNISLSITSGSLWHTHTHPDNESPACVSNLSCCDVTPWRKQGSSLGGHHNDNWKRNISCWCYGGPAQVFFLFLLMFLVPTQLDGSNADRAFKEKWDPRCHPKCWIYTIGFVALTVCCSQI